ncbi:MAG TPA: hypothetical protein OIM28_00490 [Clostridiaceae bacterium]|nr:unknown [Clostridium sp. CAG:452]HJJ03153.1 hypothetical protein [Clostridiaceae bacterium]
MEAITKDGIFNSNELYLLQNFEANLVNINLKIAEQENKRNEVTCLFDTLSKTDSVSKIGSKKDYSEEINNISEKFAKNIEKLNSLKSLLIDINSGFISLSRNASSDEVAINLKEKINSYFSTYEEIKKDIMLADIEVDRFVKRINSSNGKKSEEVSEEISDGNIQNNNTLIISEKDNKVFLPYTVSEIQSYMEKYPKEYKSLEYVINKEFILPLDYYTKHPSLARFREAYSLIRDREAKSVFDALKYALNIMFKYDLNPAIISACKTEEALNLYIECLENKDLSKFNLFKIEFRLNPLKAAKFETGF